VQDIISINFKLLLCSLVKITINILSLFVLIGLTLCSSVNQGIDQPQTILYAGKVSSDSLKIKGISFVSTNKIATCKNFESAKSASNCNWVSLMPFGFCKKDGHKIIFNSEFQWEGERTDGISKYIDSAHKCGLKVLLKPQIWLRNFFTGDFKCNNETEWKEFEDSYYDYILESAKLAEAKKVEMISIGTEWKSFVQARPLFWNRLIDSVRANYHGLVKLTSM